MPRSYRPEELKQKLFEVLNESKIGLSGVDISEKLGVNRLTMSKYLNIFATEGLIQNKKIGNINLWFVAEGTEQFQFPDDYFKVKIKFQEYLSTCSENQVYNLVRNCLYSDATIPKIMDEVIIPCIESVKKNYNDGKIGNSEEKLLTNIILKSIGLVNQAVIEVNPKKNILIMAADAQSTLLSEAAAASFHSDQWQVFALGDMSSSIDILLDLDLQKFLGKIWKQKNGVMIIAVFSSSEEGLKFFADSVNSIKGKSDHSPYLILCGNVGKKTKIKANLITEDFKTVLQWSQTVFERLET